MTEISAIRYLLTSTVILHSILSLKWNPCSRYLITDVVLWISAIGKLILKSGLHYLRRLLKSEKKYNIYIRVDNGEDTVP